jgi:hypothetical protein
MPTMGKRAPEFSPATAPAAGAVAAFPAIYFTQNLGRTDQAFGTLAGAAGLLGVGTVVVATGSRTIDPSRLPEFGYGRYRDVVTFLELEEMLVAARAMKQGLEILRPKLVQAVFVQLFQVTATTLGGGSVGVPSAYNLAKRGLKVLVLERCPAVGQGQNKAAIGGIRATHSVPGKIRLCLDSLRVFSTWQELHGDDIEWQRNGYAFVAYRPEEERTLKDLLQIQQGFQLNIRWLDQEELLQVIPDLNPRGLLGGTMLGTAYGAVFANALFLFGLAAQSPFNLQLDDSPRAFVAIAILALIGAVMGALFGVPTGFVVGVLNGLLIGIATRAFFFPLRDARTYRRVIAAASASFTGIASWFGFLAIMLFYANREKANVPMLAVIVLIPALIAGVGAGLLSRMFSRWHEQHT